MALRSFNAYQIFISGRRSQLFQKYNTDLQIHKSGYKKYLRFVISLHWKLNIILGIFIRDILKYQKYRQIRYKRGKQVQAFIIYLLYGCELYMLWHATTNNFIQMKKVAVNIAQITGNIRNIGKYIFALKPGKSLWSLLSARAFLLILFVYI